MIVEGGGAGVTGEGSAATAGRVAVAVDAFGPQWAWFAKTIKVGAIIGLTSVILVLMYGQTRIFYTMARDGLLPKPFAKVHPKWRTPYINTMLVGVSDSMASCPVRRS